MRINTGSKAGAPLLKAVNLSKDFIVDKRIFSRRQTVLKAVDNINLELAAGKTVGLVGESGCGKSTLARMLMGLIEPTGGEVWFRGKCINRLNRRSMREMRKHIQMVFQDPYSSLNPRMTAGGAIGEPLIIHDIAKGAERQELVRDIMERVGLNPGDLGKYPHEFSGGQRQRICIARALILKPDLIVADEPVSSLDVSIQAQIINLMNELQESFRLAYLMISHDLAMIRYVSDVTAVMYLGRIVEIAETAALFKAPRHPYTESLLASVPQYIAGSASRRPILKGEVPSPVNPPPGCHFHPRCYLYAASKDPLCLKPQKLQGKNSHMAACHKRQ